MAVIMFGIAPTGGHLASAIQVARNLAERGYDIVFISPDLFTRDYVAEYGFRFYQLPSPKPPPPGRLGQMVPTLGRFQKARRGLRVAKRMLTDGELIKGIFDAIGPDLIVFENTLGAYALSAMPFGKPVVLISVHASVHKRRLVPPIDARFLPRDTFFGRLRIELSWMRHLLPRKVRVLIAGSLDDIMARIARCNGLDPDKVLDRKRYINAAPRLPEFILCPEEFDFPSESADCTWCGPSIVENRPPSGFDWSWRNESRPLIYCAVGGVAPRWRRDQASSFLRRVAQAFSKEPGYDVLIATGPATFEGNFPGHIRTVAHGPQMEALRRASLFISHGGTNSIKESIWCGVPMLICPFFGDQFGNAARVQYHSLGERANRKRITPEQILALSKKVLQDDRYRRKLREFQSIFVEAEKQNNAADHIERILMESRGAAGCVRYRQGGA